MPLAAKELDRQTLRLIDYVISKFARDKKKLWKWDRSELLNDGYSDLIVTKAKPYDVKAASNPVFFVWFYIIWMTNSPYANKQAPWILFIAVYLGWRLYWQHRYKRIRLSYDDNLLVMEELKQKLGTDILERIEIEEHPLLESWNRRLERRAILWRLDAFLSRKRKV